MFKGNANGKERYKCQAADTFADIAFWTTIYKAKSRDVLLIGHVPIKTM